MAKKDEVLRYMLKNVYMCSEHPGLLRTAILYHQALRIKVHIIPHQEAEDGVENNFQYNATERYFLDFLMRTNVLAYH